ncbi:malic enzyme [Oligella sp. HMSC05A10]|uniref:NADP-dependent malic enzyme n=1 Tax=Oligella TaxID=90243 RepID=UPI00036FF193|nr:MULTISPECIES: NADP-dependent malic enzyme [Oligella]OFS83841.1 malic enzyme [Oligella sp. HMSC05A10]PMC18308.1 NADP-dependent malic enzyme [Oligella urethralis]SUA62150.1 NADP-dependent malic enzyme [Oligella urethralis]SUA68411.1 NADP-dependent malic enzyme [Oligella urethralis]
MVEKNKLSQMALDYHEFPRPGKISVTPTKPLANQDDLSLAYSPGVASACMAIFNDGEQAAARFTSRANLVGVVTNGTAVLGLGNIGPLAAKPVMEGKGGLFKKFAGIDVFDIELNEKDPEKLVDIIAALEPTLGGINLEDIKAPECFYIEKALRQRINIPVFHDDQHGTAIISAAAIINGLKLVNKAIDQVKLICSGAGAAAIACLDLLVSLGLNKENIYVCDSRGVIYEGREENLEENKARYAQVTELRTLGDAIAGADIFLGCSTKGVLTQHMVKSMAEQPLILALANPDPEITPEEAKEARPDCIIATGRSDYPNQVNNVLCFPFIFRGALDVGATCITEEMKMACVHAIAELAQIETNEEVASAYAGEDLNFGPEYIIPKPFDPRLIITIAPAVAQAAMDCGVATRPIQDMEAYKARLNAFVYQSSQLMRPLLKLAKNQQQRVIFADGEDERVLRAVQTVLDEKIAKPILIGRPEVIQMRSKKLGLRYLSHPDLEVVDPEHDERFNEVWPHYHQLMARRGVTPDVAKAMVRKHNTIIGALMIELGYGDAMICGVNASFNNQVDYIRDITGSSLKSGTMAAMNVIFSSDYTLFLCDTHINEDPTAEQIAEIALMAAEKVKRFGMVPKIALVSHSNFGNRRTASSIKMAKAREILAEIAPDLEMDGEMHADAALSEKIRKSSLPSSSLSGQANVLVMPNLDAGNITYNLLKMTSGGIVLGPVLLGTNKAIHVLTTSTTTRRIINMATLAAADAQGETRVPEGLIESKIQSAVKKTDSE